MVGEGLLVEGAVLLNHGFEFHDGLRCQAHLVVPLAFDQFFHPA